MNLLHHLVVGETLREALLWPTSLRAQVLLGSIAPDAHTEVPGLDRTIFHPAPEEDVVARVLEMTEPFDCMRTRRGRAFAAAAIAHVVADWLTREHRYHLPPHAPEGFQPVEGERADAPNVIDLTAMTRSLMRARSVCGLGPMSPGAIDRKRWELLGRWPLSDGGGLYLVVEPLATVARHCAGEALTRMYRSDAGASLLGSWRP